jgi:hypothetical protein
MFKIVFRFAKAVSEFLDKRKIAGEKVSQYRAKDIINAIIARLQG